jgi:hypothetical protein
VQPPNNSLGGCRSKNARAHTSRANSAMHGGIPEIAAAFPVSTRAIRLDNEERNYGCFTPRQLAWSFWP